jgi:hypothetical protein
MFGCTSSQRDQCKDQGVTHRNSCSHKFKRINRSHQSISAALDRHLHDGCGSRQKDGSLSSQKPSRTNIDARCIDSPRAFIFLALPRVEKSLASKDAEQPL